MSETRRTLLWSLVALAMMGLAVPWFLWGTDAVVAGLPVWIWWHVGWLVLCTVVFYVFTDRAWGVGVESGGVRHG
jgi:hypothetical protein